MKIVGYLVFASFILFGIGKIGIVAERNQDDLDVMNQVIKQEKNITIEGWSVTAREAINSITTEKDFAKEFNRIKEKNPNFIWNIQQDSHKYVTVGTKKGAYFEETITIASTVHSKQESYITYEIRGKKLKSAWISNIGKAIEHRKHAVFSGNTTFFTCIEGQFNDTIDKVLTSMIDNWLQKFKAQEVESLKEKDFISITAKSSLFEQSQISEHYNLQLAMRSDGMGARTTFVIGTPIITFEY
ncbi:MULTISPECIES: YwmB family TATA-box binding protein [Bacillus]|uniref:YwmB family TATA-box binding protein n=1 Tax=Bacillus TaxID=1386 RepID=UPI0002F955F3|nr:MULTISPECIES: YwmB family TATA-box binding protein [Bacillus]